MRQSRRLAARATLVLLALACVGCGSGRTELAAATALGLSEALVQSEADRLVSEARGRIESWDESALAGQALMVGVGGSVRLAPESRRLLEEIRPGAVLLFGYNVEGGPRGLSSLCQEITLAAARDGLPPFIAIDHEGGRVYRFKAGLTRLPSAARLGRAGLSAAAAAGEIAGTELRALGVTMNLAPVVEAGDEANASVLGDRAWARSPETAAELAAAFIASCEAAGVAAVAKHFPGNGSVDPHRGPSRLEASGSEAERRYLEPFSRAIDAGVSSVMLSHAIAPFLDPELPASLSPTALARLRGELGFQGIAMTDDVQMAAVEGLGTPGQLAVAALRAGADLIMVSGQAVAREARDALRAEAILDPRFKDRLRDAAARQVAQRLRFGLDIDTPEAAASRLEGLADLVESNRARLEALLASPGP